LTNAGASLQVIQQIVSLGATVGGRVAAELLAGGAAAIQEANRLLAVVDSVSQAAGIVAAKRFFQGGIDAANAFIDAVKRQIQGLNSIIDDILARLMKVFEMQNRATGGGGGGGGGQLFTELGRGGVTQAGIEMVRQGANIPDSVVASYIISDPFNTTLEEYARQLGITGFAKGAIVNRPMMGLVGEAGPEAIIPLNRSSGMGATYNITVNAGMGANGADLGRAVVEAIRKYEKIAGQQFAGV
jgi:hypothetical protein